MRTTIKNLEIWDLPLDENMFTKHKRIDNVDIYRLNSKEDNQTKLWLRYAATGIIDQISIFTRNIKQKGRIFNYLTKQGVRLTKYAQGITR